ncbi:MAG: hypothetical protein JXR73_06215 [Candidatus Omnitrophica bacterium]|nr:hypothetical protein [Candidatus Omnitrophota bacterium]
MDYLEIVREHTKKSQPSNSESITCSEAVKMIAAVQTRLNKIWPDIEPGWDAQDHVNETVRAGDRSAFYLALKDWENIEKERVQGSRIGK